MILSIPFRKSSLVIILTKEDFSRLSMLVKSYMKKTLIESLSISSFKNDCSGQI